jgi:uncharacterized protein YndB with AHSA1/START domain
MQKDIFQKWFFQQPPGKVWEYLTKPDLMEQWLMKTDFQPIVGQIFRFTFVPKPDSEYKGVLRGEVLEVTPLVKLSYSWDGYTKDGRSFTSKVVWTLFPKDNGTELQLLHQGFTILEDILNHTSGWNICLKRFEELINGFKK